MNTIDYYNNNSQEYFNSTINIDMLSQYSMFLKYVKMKKGFFRKTRILDFGCGSGRDSKYFKELGYEVDAIDFALKPLTYASFYLRLERVMKKLNKKSDSFLVVPCDGGFNKINISDVLYVEVISHDIIFHMMSGQNITTSGTLKKYDEKLKDLWFIRCNSCYLVNAHKIKRVEKLDIQLVNDEVIAISHPKKKSFMERFKKYVLEEGE